MSWVFMNVKFLLSDSARKLFLSAIYTVELFKFALFIGLFGLG